MNRRRLIKLAASSLAVLALPAGWLSRARADLLFDDMFGDPRLAERLGRRHLATDAGAGARGRALAAGLAADGPDAGRQRLAERRQADLESLDLVVVDDLAPFFDRPGDFFIIRDDDLFRRKPLRKVNPARDAFLHSVGNSSVFRYRIGSHAYILDAYLADPKAATANYEISQQFQSAQLAARGHLHYWPRGWCVSFKNDCVPRNFRSYFADPSLPEGAKIVLFAGAPKMADVFAGRGHKWYRRIGDIGWLRQAWQG